MKILMLSNMYPSSKSPGYGTFVRSFETAMRVNGACVDKAVIDVQPKGILGKLVAYIPYAIRSWRKLFFTSHDIIYVHYAAHSLLPVTLIHKLLKKPLVVNAHGSDVLPQGRINRILLKLNFATIRRAQLIVVPSEYYREVVSRLFPASDVVVSPSSGIDLQKFSPGLRPKDDGQYKIGFVSRLIPGKGWKTFLSALALCKKRGALASVKVDLIGGGEDLDACANMVSSLGLSDMVQLHGAVGHEELPDFFRSFDVFVFPSERKSESLGLVGLEAMACGCPVIGSDTPGISTYLQDGVNGFTFATGSHESLAKAIEDYFALSSDERRTLGDRALQTSREYETGLVGKRLYSELIERFDKS